MTTIEAATRNGTPTRIDEAKLQELQAGFRGRLLRPGDPGYDQARQVYNGMFDRRPALIARCRATADVIDAVNFARETDLLIAVRGGGHNVAGNSMCDGGIVIDLAEMSAVHVDRKNQTVRAQGGATWGDMDRETQAFGLATPGGIVSTTGIAGLTLNGGLGWLRSKHGLSCDNLVSAEVVTASGELVTASATENADLFWALRGGGGNFGVVTSFEFKAHPVGPIVAAAIPFYPMKDAAGIIRQWREFAESAPEEISTACVMWTMPNVEALPPEIRGQAVCITAGVYAGPADLGEAALKPLRGFAPLLFDMSGQMPFRGVNSSFDPFFPKDGTIRSYWKSVYADQLSDAAIDICVDRMMNRTSSYALMNIPHFGNAVRRVKPDETAFATRTSPYMISIDANWTDPSDDGKRHIAWARDCWDRLQPHSTGAQYLSFSGFEESTNAENVVKSAYGTNYDRLAQIKAKYDPDNIFRMNQNIKPQA